MRRKDESNQGQPHPWR